MNDRRLKWLIVGLGVLLLIRWLDPWPQPARPAALDVAHAMVRAESRPGSKSPSPQPPIEAAGVQSDRHASVAPVQDIFTARSGVELQRQESESLAEQRSIRVQHSGPPERPPEVVAPQEAPPPLQVIGTWAVDDGPAVFMTSPQGTVMARESELVLELYKVQRIEAGQVSLQNSHTRKVWQLPIPTTTSANFRWSSRPSP